MVNYESLRHPERSEAKLKNLIKRIFEYRYYTDLIDENKFFLDKRKRW